MNESRRNEGKGTHLIRSFENLDVGLDDLIGSDFRYRLLQQSHDQDEMRIESK